MYFHGNTEHFYFVDSYIYADSSKKGKVLVRFHGSNSYVNVPQYNIPTLSCFLQRTYPAILKVEVVGCSEVFVTSYQKTAVFKIPALRTSILTPKQDPYHH
jgi:hypothetical protein